jgi:hypothetical protein
MYLRVVFIKYIYEFEYINNYSQRFYKYIAVYIQILHILYCRY